jgi:penicillin-binding protein 2
LGLVSKPSFDPNELSGGATKEEIRDAFRRLFDNALKPALDKTVSGAYPPGSTFKPITASAGLQSGTISTRTQIFCPGVISLRSHYDPSVIYHFRCWLGRGHGAVNVVDALGKSCDVYFYELGGGYTGFDGLGAVALSDWAGRFGFGRPTGVDLPGEVGALVPSPNWKESYKQEPWTQGDTYQMAIGQGILAVTPLQLLSATVAIANGGSLFRPRVVSRITDFQGNEVRRATPPTTTSVGVDPAWLEVVRRGMRMTVSGQGTAPPHLNGLPTEVRVAGKTGTAEFCEPVQVRGTWDCRRDKNGNQQAHAWFTAFAPYDNPDIALVVLVEATGTGKVLQGSSVAAPIAAKIMRRYFGLPEWRAPAPSPVPSPTDSQQQPEQAARPHSGNDGHV